ncbi:di-trans,poly-cis-decaprenylcistransferase, partial [Candidatus Woesearchaeota archaeon]|nr:di-trans,poly-cis-decaprenylcistransferase [Candidatus Woesearchaeota archaeon]
MHIGIILDGNRRWAKKRGLPPWAGHKKGAENLKDLLKWCDEIELEELSLYAFSMQNFKRTEEEKKELFKIFKDYFSEMLEEKNLKEFKEKGVEVRILGRIDLFPEELCNLLKEVMAKTKGNGNRRVNFCMAYGGREEIVDAANKAIEKGKKVDEDTFAENLYMNSDVDLVIRTGGDGEKAAKRTSNFLIWQTAYAEWFFLKELFPELTKERFLSIIEEFKQRERRYGK